MSLCQGTEVAISCADQFLKFLTTYRARKVIPYLDHYLSISFSFKNEHFQIVCFCRKIQASNLLLCPGTGFQEKVLGNTRFPRKNTRFPTFKLFNVYLSSIDFRALK